MSLQTFMLTMAFIVFGHFVSSVNKSAPSDHVMRKITYWFIFVIIECVMILLLLAFSRGLQTL